MSSEITQFYTLSFLVRLGYNTHIALFGKFWTLNSSELVYKNKHKNNFYSAMKYVDIFSLSKLFLVAFKMNV